MEKEIYRLLFLSHPLEFYFPYDFLFSQIKTFCIFRFLCVGVYLHGKGTLFEDLSGEIKFIFFPLPEPPLDIFRRRYFTVPRSLT